ncbi:MAG: glycosyltransferase [Chloroflexi bacterium]|nr:MAG: glycosyltransferase [Chloroflexota bacterium]
MTVRVSVVVPTCNRPEMLGRCLAALRDQDLDPTEYEIIIADDGAGNGDATRRLVEESARLRGGPGLRYLPLAEQRGPAAARNAGWRAARGDVVAFTDDDCVPTPGWLSAGLEAFYDGVAGASGRVVVPLPSRPTDYELNAGGLNRSKFVTASCFYRHDALRLAGGFDERFGQAWREDSDLFFTLLERQNGGGQHLRLVHVPDALVIHPVRPAPWGISLRQQRKSMYNALLYKKHPRLYRRWFGPVTPWGYYGTVASAVAAVGALTAGRRRLALLSGLAWALLTGRFFLQRLRGTSRRPGHLLEMALTSPLIPFLSVYWRLRGAVRFRVPFL